jgi:hypothetical protein
MVYNMYKYIGEGAYWPGVPMRDLTDEEWEALSGDAKRHAKTLYQKVVEKKKEVSSDASKQS